MEPTVYVNPARATPSVVGPDDHDDDHDRKVEANVLGFHRKLPHYEETPLHSFPGLAEELELGHVFVKDESKRLGLPSFKILGASWAVFRAVGEELGLNLDSLENDAVAEVGLAEGAVEGRFVSTPGWQKLASDAREQELSLVTCTEGNWGRAVASMAKYLSIPVKIFVPSFMPETTLARIRSEGTKAVVERVEGNYDDSVAAARREATTREGAILVMDMGWDGYEKIPGVGLLVLSSAQLITPPRTDSDSGLWKATAQCYVRPTCKYTKLPTERQRPTPSSQWVWARSHRR